jgi:hypothetical protein
MFLAKKIAPLVAAPKADICCASFFLSFSASFSQHGFLKGRGTQTALFEFMNNFYFSLLRSARKCWVFLWLVKCILYNICTPVSLHKFELLGVRGVALNWLTSALTGRTQCAKLQDIVNGKFQKDVFSSFLPVTRGTPQGGIISPFSFDVGIFDTALYVSIGILLNYVDDSSNMVAAPTSAWLYIAKRGLRLD